MLSEQSLEMTSQVWCIFVYKPLIIARPGLGVADDKTTKLMQFVRLLSLDRTSVRTDWRYKLCNELKLIDVYFTTVLHYRTVKHWLLLNLVLTKTKLLGLLVYSNWVWTLMFISDVCPDPPSFMIKLSDLDVSLKGKSLALSLSVRLDL